MSKWRKAGSRKAHKEMFQIMKNQEDKSCPYLEKSEPFNFVFLQQIMACKSQDTYPEVFSAPANSQD